MKAEIAAIAVARDSGATLNRRTPSYGATARAGARKRRNHGPLGIAVPETDNLDVKKWKGQVIRLADLSSDARVALGDQTLTPSASAHETWMCRAPYCRQWTTNGAHRRGRCNWCDEPRPTHPIGAR